MDSNNLRNNFWDYASQGLIAFDENFQLVDYNTAFTNHTKFPDNELSGITLHQFIKDWQGINLEGVINELKAGNVLKEECWIKWDEYFGHFRVEFLPVEQEGQIKGTYVVIYLDSPLMDETVPIPHQELIEALNFTQESILITDAKLEKPGPRIVYANPGFTKMTGYNKSEIVGKTPRILQGPETDRTEIDRLKSCLENDQRFEGEIINYRKDGTPFVMQWEITSLTDNAGHIRYYLAVQRDVTEIRAIEQKFQDSKTRLIQYLDKSPEGIAIHSKEKIIYANEEATQLVGYDDPDQLVGKHIFDFLKPEDKPYVEKRIDYLLSHAEDSGIDRLEMALITRDGTEKEVQIAGIPCIYRGNEAIEIVLIDISERIAAERESRIQAEKYQRIAENAGDMIGLHAPDTTFKYASPATYENTGYSPDELIGESPFLFIHEADQDYITELYHKVLSGESVKDARFRIQTKGGNTLWVQSQFIPIKGENGEVEEIQTVTHEVTHEQEMQILLEEAQHIAKIGGWGYDSNTGKILLSPKLKEILNLPQDTDPSIQEIIDMHDEAYQPLAKACLTNLIKYGTSYDEVFKLNINDTPKWIHVVGKPFYMDQRLYNLGGAVQDITEEKEAELALKEQQHFNQKITANIPAIILIFDIHSKQAIYANNKLIDLLGYTQADFNQQIAHKRDELIHPSDREDFERLLASDLTAKDGEVHQIQVRMLTKDNSYKWFQIAHTPFKRDEKGAVKEVLVTTEDVNEWRQMLESHKWNENFFRQLVENSPIAMLILDPDYKVQDSNHAFQKLFQWDLLEIRGESTKSFLLPQGHEDEYNKIIQKSLKGETYFVETTRKNKDGEVIDVLVFNIPVFVQHELLGTLHGLMDISQRKQHEKALREQTDELLRINEELERFAYITSHNLRAHLANMTGLFNILDKSAINDPSNREIVDLIEKSTQGLNETINDMVEIVSKRNQLNQPKERISLDELAEKVKLSLNEQIQDTNAVIVTDFREVPSIKFVRITLEQVFYQLVDNALKFRSVKRNPHIKISTEKEDGYNCIKFADNGLGFDANTYKEAIFAFYKQLYPDQPGKGKGLYLLKYQVEAMGGHIQVESREDEGSTFYIYLKADDTQNA